MSLIEHPLLADDGAAFGIPGEPNGRNIAAQVVASVREQQSRIVANWAVRVSTMPAFRAMPEIHLDALQSQIPELLDATLIAITAAEAGMATEALEHAQSLAIRHGILRHEEGVAIGVLLTELHLLRREVGNALSRAVESIRADGALAIDLERRLHGTFDSLVVSAAGAWVGV